MGVRPEARVGEDMESRKLSCDQAVLRFFEYLDRALTGAPLEALETHLEECLDCCDRLQFSRKLDAFVKERLGETALPEGIEDRIRRVLAG